MVEYNRRAPPSIIGIIDMSIAMEPDPVKYDTFNAFFTRALKPDVRPQTAPIGTVISPIDGSVSQYGRISNGRLVQAKGKEFTLLSLLGGDQALASKFANGEFITLYLSPRDYHRIHMPISGELQTMIYVPGKLFSVSPETTREIDNLFARNERVINIFNTEIGSMALIMVGAIFVGSMETVWAGEITPASVRRQTINDYVGSKKVIQLGQGDEAGRFNMGSTVILLFEQGKLNWDSSISVDAGIHLGQVIAKIATRR